MNRRVRLSLLAGILLLAAPPLVAAEGDVSLEGGFVWEREDGNHQGDLKATLTPAGDGEWSCVFNFEWEDGPHAYAGTCRGSLSGELSGDIVSDGERAMKFKFSGAFKGGGFSGTHGFVTEEGELRNSGTLTLAAPAKS